MKSLTRLFETLTGTFVLVAIIGIPIDIIFALGQIRRNGYQELIPVIGGGILQSFILSIPLYVVFKRRTSK